MNTSYKFVDALRVTMRVLLVLIILVINSFSAIRDTRFALLSRQKRALVYQEGLNWIQMVIGIGLPVEVKDTSITMGAAVKSYYELPNNSTYYTNPIMDLERRKRSTSRWDLYYALQHFAESFGYENGKSCLLRTICESASTPFDSKSGLFAEILHLLFTPSCTNEVVENSMDYEYHAAERLGKGFGNCERMFPCDVDFMNRFSKVFI